MNHCHACCSIAKFAVYNSNISDIILLKAAVILISHAVNLNSSFLKNSCFGNHKDTNRHCLAYTLLHFYKDHQHHKYSHNLNSFDFEILRQYNLGCKLKKNKQ